MNGMADDEQTHEHPHGPTPAGSRPPVAYPDGRRETRRRRLAAAGWLCAVAAAFLLGAWSFSHADTGDRYGRPEPLGDAGVRHELAQARQRAGSQGTQQDTPPSPSASAPSGSPSATAPGDAPPGDAPRAGTVRTSTVRFPDGLGTAIVACRTDARTVELLSWTPAQGYSADDVEAGPARSASVELEPGDDDEDDLLVHVRCAHGKPQATVTKDTDDDEDEDDD
ncbi:hypothetical protein [Streptomyces albus]|uniref:hypothetical protein n=1 Tax=Streptomyces albus TaxID=1888 RepID=UPI0024E0F472|nr:hypothetical protein [Streptomyces albus]